jgi:hypothetical protein
LSIQSELKHLFNADTIRQSKKLKPDRVDALAVQEAAGALLRLKGQPNKQIALVSTLPPSTAVALCRWLDDPSFWGLVGNVTRH